MKWAFGVLLFAVAIWIVQRVLHARAVLGARGMLLLVAGFMLRQFEAHSHTHAPHRGRGSSRRSASLQRSRRRAADVERAAAEGRRHRQHCRGSGVAEALSIVRRFFDPQGRELEGVRVIGFQDAERFARTLQVIGR